MDPGKLGNYLTKRDYIIIIRVEGPGNSLDRSYHYSNKKDINFIAERVNNTNVGFSNLFWRHDKSWINRKVRSVNLRFHWALFGCGKCHIRVIETTSFQREELTTHSLHINSRGKKKLTLLIAKSLGDKNVSDTSIIPVIPVQKVSPYLA
jgi:hypothetical protein